MLEKKILIVGGSRGIGLSLAKKALSQNSEVTVIARKKIDDLQNSEIKFIQQDFNDISLARPTLLTFQPNILILCVAQGLYGDVLRFSNEQIFQCIKTSLISTIIWLKEAIDILPENSKIGWISSLTAKMTSHSWSYYASAKAGVDHFIDCARQIAIARGISITICYPGCVATGFHKRAGTETPANAVEPSEIAEDLLQAIGNSLDFWASDMDKDFIEEIYKFNKNHRCKFGELLK